MTEKKKLVFIGSDHGGFNAKKELVPFLKESGFDVTDLGCFTDEPCDYPDVAREVAEKAMEHPEAFGILLCGSGIGVSIAANKVQGVRAALANSEELAELARKHNNANVLCLGARLTTVPDMKKIVIKFMNTGFENTEERHARRVQKLNDM
ncbi:MAG: ribose 5-phosphate isomerase B [bacterium]|nr:ribose 5-phosphate isomerase B [bacterium]